MRHTAQDSSTDCTILVLFQHPIHFFICNRKQAHHGLSGSVSPPSIPLFHPFSLSSTAELITLPRKDEDMDLVRAIDEAKSSVGTGYLPTGGGGRGGTEREKIGAGSYHGSPARIEGSLWATHPTLLAYSDLMLDVPEELTSSATALYCMVRIENELG